jgi:hypothetical protein
VLSSCGALDWEALCVTPGKFSWLVALDVVVLQAHGNLLDLVGDHDDDGDDDDDNDDDDDDDDEDDDNDDHYALLIPRAGEPRRVLGASDEQASED